MPDELARLEAGIETATSADSEETGRELFRLEAKACAAKRPETELRAIARRFRDFGMRLGVVADHEFFFVCGALGAR